MILKKHAPEHKFYTPVQRKIIEACNFLVMTLNLLGLPGHLHRYRQDLVDGDDGDVFCGYYNIVYLVYENLLYDIRGSYV